MSEQLGERSEGQLPALAAKFHADDQLYRTIRRFGSLIVICFGLYQLRLAVVAFAGKDTQIQFSAVLRAFADIRIALAVTLAGLTSAWAVAERRLRQRNIKRLHARVKELETSIDPARQSSGLTEIGRTNPQDREL